MGFGGLEHRHPPTFTSLVSQIYFLTVNYNSTDLIKRLLNSIAINTKYTYHIVIVNNSVGDKDICSLKTEATTILEPEENLGFGRACNLGIQWIVERDSNAIVWLINPDAYFAENSSDSIERAIAFFNKHPNISILGTTVYDSAGETISAGGKFAPGSAALEVIDSFPIDLEEDYIATDWVSGCSLLINLANFTQPPQFDPRYFLYYEDLDFCIRYGQQGHKIAVTNLLKVSHDTSTISDRNLLQKYRHITKSYLIHVEKHGSSITFTLTNLRMLLNTVRLLILKPQQGRGKAIGIYDYWYSRLTK